MKMHGDEVDIDTKLVETMVAAQFPELAKLPVRAVQSNGTVNAIFRIGDHLCARLPRRSEWVTDLRREWKWLPMIARRVQLRIPEPVGMGVPSTAYPLPWAVYRWIEGQAYADRYVDDETMAAADIATFVRELRRVEPAADAPPGGRQPLTELDRVTRKAIVAGRDVIDGDAAMRAWDQAIASPVWDGAPVWIHADLLRPNILVRAGRVVAVIDFGGAGVGDPATDVIPAWSVFGPTGRQVFRDALHVDDGTWERARGIALHQAALIIPYYRRTNSAFAALARRTVEQVLADTEH